MKTSRGDKVGRPCRGRPEWRGRPPFRSEVASGRRDLLACPYSRRRGLSLVEIMTVIVLVGTLLAMVTSLLVSVVGLDATTRRELQTTDAFTMLELQLRSDAHRSTGAEMNQDRLTLTTEDGKTIEWTVANRGVQRQVQFDGETKHRELWPLSGRHTSHWSTQEKHGKPWIRLEIESLESGNRATLSPERNVSIECVLPGAMP